MEQTRIKQAKRAIEAIAKAEMAAKRIIESQQDAEQDAAAFDAQTTGWAALALIAASAIGDIAGKDGSAAEEIERSARAVIEGRTGTTTDHEDAIERAMDAIEEDIATATA